MVTSGGGPDFPEWEERLTARLVCPVTLNSAAAAAQGGGRRVCVRVRCETFSREQGAAAAGLLFFPLSLPPALSAAVKSDGRPPSSLRAGLPSPPCFFFFFLEPTGELSEIVALPSLTVLVGITVQH